MVYVILSGLQGRSLHRKFAAPSRRLSLFPDFAVHAAREQERRDNIMNALNDSSLDITAELGKTTLDMYDVLNLQVDDIIPLEKSINSNVILKIGDRVWFDGKLGSFNQNKAVKIENVFRIEV